LPQSIDRKPEEVLVQVLRVCIQKLHHHLRSLSVGDAAWRTKPKIRLQARTDCQQSMYLARANSSVKEAAVGRGRGFGKGNTPRVIGDGGIEVHRFGLGERGASENTYDKKPGTNTHDTPLMLMPSDNARGKK
jgi:hypothetical protein